ncbi:MAG: hypothetical protein ABGZ35_16465, partial [Planctomycetaceae bacterium]
MEFELIPFNVTRSLLQWAQVTGVIALLAVGAGFLASMRLGPSGTKHFRRGLSSYLSDIMAMSPTRILAIARLTLKEAN